MVVMVQPAHDRQCDHLAARMMREPGCSAWFRNVLLDALMWSCLIEVDHIRVEHAARAASPAESAGGPSILAARSSKSVRRWRWLVTHELAS